MGGQLAALAGNSLACGGGGIVAVVMGEVRRSSPGYGHGAEVVVIM